MSGENKVIYSQEDISNVILSVAMQRGTGKSTCPSEIARLLFPGGWRKHMKDVRDVAIELHRAKKVSSPKREYLWMLTISKGLSELRLYNPAYAI